MDSATTLQTPRLLLTPLQAADATAIQQLFPHWEVVRYLDSRAPWPYPDDGAEQYVRSVVLPAIREGKQWHWMIRLAAVPEQCIGSLSLYDEPDNNRGFWLSPPWQGQGNMQEACEVINRFWFEGLERPVMRVPKAVGNAASRRVSEREGMRLVDVTTGNFVSGPLSKELWELRREHWLKQPRRQASH
ncbi:GNAT family N-acetyltransferase [Pseudomonas sp. LP_7_YM]|uniref:GNAT family N-acetyltransferase n=1 Tax=Pseudomonas sp. LP_7_YM TaxID=2485137 RepID=UPI00105F76C8|nr:GNAT family N-acetyltransferase [Pseudomonas sp. LP_7_YM]TDV72729.1 RimJ/RimL family protein N-acetyltransferase [Pseudomonas sp. LP_7_YM]